jgi:hypothetical protein
MFWQRGNGRHEEPAPPVDEPTRDELLAMDEFLRDRECIMRRTKQWEHAWPSTDLLESLRAKLWRRFHREEAR